MITDAELLSSIPDFVSFETLMKAHAATEGNSRIIYVEASNEARDQQGEVILEKALKESVDHFMKFGVLDIDHKSMPSVAKSYGIDCPEEWAIGQPIDVSFRDGTTFVKSRLYQGDTPLASRANMVWDGLTKLNPPARYYASVGGAVLGREVKIDPDTMEKVAVVSRVRWNNLALSASPVNQHLSTASTVPVGTFAKSLGGFVIAKSLTAGYGTDSATLTGGDALRGSNGSDRGGVLDYWNFRDQFAHLVHSGEVGHGIKNMVMEAVSRFQLSRAVAAEYVERFLDDLKRGLKKEGP